MIAFNPRSGDPDPGWPHSEGRRAHMFYCLYRAQVTEQYEVLASMIMKYDDSQGWHLTSQRWLEDAEFWKS